MTIDDTVSHLEMTSPAQLRPVASSTPEIVLRLAGPAQAELVRAQHDRVAGPFGWESLVWTLDRWREFLDPATLRTTWIPEIDGEPAGLVTVQVQPGGDVEIEFYGLAPEYCCRGLGGRLLTLVTEQAWALPPAGSDRAVNRIWLRTSSYDHPRALPGYQGRGYLLYRTEHRERELVAPPVAH